MHRFDPAGIRRLRDTMERHVTSDAVGGVAWLAACGDDVEVGVAGNRVRGEDAPIQRDSIFRISSMTKPIAAVAALILIEECRLRLDDPVDDLLPELAGRPVLVDGRGPMDGPTVPANRSITVRDVLTFRLGWGMDFDAPWPQPLMERMAELGLGLGPPDPSLDIDPDEWIKRISTMPLQYQPGERWLYNVGAQVLGALLARAANQSLPAFLAERVLEPLGMKDTAFVTTDVDRFTTCYATDPQAGTRSVWDAPDGRWTKMPAFPSAADGLVSTLDDLHAFGRMLRAGGRLPDGSRLLSRASIDAMTTDQLGVDRGAPGPLPDGSQGWGFGLAVQLRRTGLAPAVGTYGWAGGMGTSWANDPGNELIGIVLTTDAFASAFPPPAIVQDFWTCTYAALDD